MEGFKSYREQHTFNFESRTLFGIVGPTGAGKSSILEALIFGLFGKTPRLERDTKKLIHSGCDEAKVQISFESAGSAWEVTRVIRTKGPSHVLLKTIDGAGDPVNGDRAVNERIAEILGLDFAAFCASVSLPQGEFDRFLKATSAERVRILKGVFGLEKVNQLREAAKGRWNLINAQTAGLASAREMLPENPTQVAEELKQSAATAAKLLSAISEALPEVRRAEQQLDRSSARITSISERRLNIRAALDSLPPEANLIDIESAIDKASFRWQTAERDSAEAAERVRESNAKAESLEAEGRGQAWCSKLEAELRAQAQLLLLAEQASSELDALSEKVEQAETDLAQARESHSHHESELVAARAKLFDLHQKHRAHLLRSDLVAGEACPVCEQVVPSLPSAKVPEALGNAETALATAERAASKAAMAQQVASESRTLALDRVQGAQARAKSLSVDRRSREVEIFDLTRGAADPGQELLDARAQLEASKASLKAAMVAQDAARSAEKLARLEVENLAVTHKSLVGKVNHVCGRLDLNPSSVEDESLAGLARRAREAGQELINELDAEIEQMRLSAIEESAVIDEFRKGFGARPQDSCSDVAARSAAEASRLERDWLEAEKAVVQAQQIEAECKRLTERKGLYDRLTQDLTDHKFTAHLLEEQRRILSIGASEKFRELTGRYVFDEQGDFQVLDLRTGAVRSPDTLSGGEGFLASLSLALALAETIGREGGPLGSFFLDEGFGSLDPESLELALDGIEGLAVPGRLIGLISHVGGIQSRLDDLIVLERNDDGSTSVCQEAGPIGYATNVF